MGIIKKVHICKKCQIKTYSFLGYFFAKIDLEDMSKFVNINIENAFLYQNKHYIKVQKYCAKCLEQTTNLEILQYFSMPDYLIIMINRGKNNSCRFPFPLKLNISIPPSHFSLSFIIFKYSFNFKQKIFYNLFEFK